MPRSFATLIYWLTAAVVLFLAALGAIGSVRSGWIAQGAAYAIIPPLWAILCSATLAAFSKRTRPGTWRVAGRTLLIALFPMGALFGFVLGGLSGLGASYGNGDVELSQNFVVMFALGAVIALVPSLVIAAIAVSVALVAKRPRDTSTPAS